MAVTMTATVVMGFLSLLFLLFWTKVLVQTLRLPPGPRPLPVVGNALLMRKYETLADFAAELKRQYGPICTVWLFSKPVVFISDPEIIREAMIKQGSVFMGRIQLESTKVLQQEFRGVISGDGERNRFLRKLLLTDFLKEKRVAGLRPIREQELDNLVDSLRKQLGNGDSKGGNVTNCLQLIRRTISTLTMSTFLGERCPSEVYANLNEVMGERFRLARGVPSDFISFLAWLPDRKNLQAQWKLREKTCRVLSPLFEERKKARESVTADYRPAYVDTLFAIRDGKIESPVEISDADVELICMELLNGGTETTALTVEYCLANLINYPETQEQVAQEISAAVGARIVNEADIPQLPYLRAIVREVLRRHPPARLAPPRRALTATKLAGYHIPKGTILVQHLEAVSLSPDIWEDPFEFRPDRHLNKTPDVTGAHEIKMIPFGVGRRRCPAIGFAILHVELILARLIQEFEWKSGTPGQPKVDLTSKEGFSNPMKYPLVAALEERVKI